MGRLDAADIRLPERMDLAEIHSEEPAERRLKACGRPGHSVIDEWSVRLGSNAKIQVVPRRQTSVLNRTEVFCIYLRRESSWRNRQIPTCPLCTSQKRLKTRIYAYWESNGLFKPSGNQAKPAFSIVMPPPNVTGSLHIGHAMDNTLQDIIIRYKRMQGFDTLWVPGTDHAGIATQARVEQALRETEGKTRHELGREAFIERVWDWKQQYGDVITNQIRRLGASCDWSRERFTMDAGLSGAVREVFVGLYEKGLIYRGNRIINWCPRCETALSDIEVEHEDVDAKLYHVRYPAVGTDTSVIIATTRPETMFADVAVAVHPDDPRFQALVGKEVKLPLTNRVLPVIADAYVDMEFGTGCLKITPAHDPNDFEIGQRHQLPSLQCIDSTGHLTELAGRFAGLDREAARSAVVSELKALGFLVEEEELRHAVGHCERCGTVVEPYLSEQWFVAMRSLADRALEELRAGNLNFVPDRFEKVFVHWLEEVRDWCISRQLWWGHQIPAWYCDDCGEISVSRDDLTTCAHCDSNRIRRDSDVLDTWFSSALWPFSTMGWPEQTSDFARYYPTNALMTGYDIVFFWVARMVFMGLQFTDQLPFRDVVLHGLIRAADGSKMSKSKGNGVDPIEVIDQYGADALRFMLSTGTSPGNDQRFRYERIEGIRNFINKIWNASRFVQMTVPDRLSVTTWDVNTLGVADRWILSRLQHTIQSVTEHLNRYDFGEAGRALYDFTWDEFCDWYIELSKLTLYGEDEAQKQQTQAVLTHVHQTLLKLLHPFIPFVTEEIWQSLPGTDGALIVADFPVADASQIDERAVSRMSVVMEAIRAVRNIRAERNVAPSKPVPMRIRAVDVQTESLLESVRAYFVRFCNLSDLQIGMEVPVPEQAVTAVVTGAELFLPLAGLVDLDAERDRLQKERDRLSQEVERVLKKLSNEQFVAKAPVAVVEAGESEAAGLRGKAENR